MKNILRKTKSQTLIGNISKFLYNRILVENEVNYCKRSDKCSWSLLDHFRTLGHVQLLDQKLFFVVSRAEILGSFISSFHRRVTAVR